MRKLGVCGGTSVPSTFQRQRQRLHPDTPYPRKSASQTSLKGKTEFNETLASIYKMQSYRKTLNLYFRHKHKYPRTHKQV